MKGEPLRGLESESSPRIMKTPRAEAVLRGRACEPQSRMLWSRFRPCQGHCNHRGRCLGDEMSHVGPLPQAQLWAWMKWAHRDTRTFKLHKHQTELQKRTRSHARRCEGRGFSEEEHSPLTGVLGTFPARKAAFVGVLIYRDRCSDLCWELFHEHRRPSRLNGTKGKEKVLVARSRPTVWDPTDCSPPGSSVHGILQARTLE